ncbi:MAG: potassium channel family protein [Desulfopila sp.]|jgi:voltage-gated potassium channel|nr:potassium channel family protein [Desulfopila sp.]
MEFTIRFLQLFSAGLYLAAPILLFFVCVIVALGQVVGRLEKWKAFDAFYWSFITATTVGYGDLRPTRKISRCLSLLIALTGLVFTGIVIAIALETASLSFSLSDSFDTVKEQLRHLR